MLTDHVARKFVRTRRLRDVSDRIIEVYKWALPKLDVVYPDELPMSPKEMQKLFTAFPMSRQSQGSHPGGD